MSNTMKTAAIIGAVAASFAATGVLAPVKLFAQQD